MYIRLAALLAATILFRVGQNHIYTVHIRYFWQGNYQIHGVNLRFWPTLIMFCVFLGHPAGSFWPTFWTVLFATAATFVFFALPYMVGFPKK
jgi:hypothetical protein